MTWDRAYRLAEQQVVEWKRNGIGPAEALLAIHSEMPVQWRQVRQAMAAWVMLHRERWEE